MTEEERIAELEAQLIEAGERCVLLDMDLLTAEARITDLEAQLAAAEDVAEAYQLELQDAAARTAEIEALKADAARLRTILQKVEEWFASEAGPIYRLWEDMDICNYDNRECEWEETLAEVRDFNIPANCLGYGTEWPAVTLYRAILLALRPAGQPAESEGKK